MDISQSNKISFGDDMLETIPSNIYLSKYSDYISTTLEITNSSIIINGNTGNTGNVLTCKGNTISWEPVTITSTGFTGTTGTISTTVSIPTTKSIILQNISSVNKYKINLCGTIVGIKDYLLIYVTVNGISCNTFNSSYPYYVQYITHSSISYISYTIIDTIDMSSSPLTIGSIAEIQIYIRCGSGIHTITSNHFNVSIEPVY